MDTIKVSCSICNETRYFTIRDMNDLQGIMDFAARHLPHHPEYQKAAAELMQRFLRMERVSGFQTSTLRPT